VSIWKRPGAAKNFALFVYHLAEASYYVFKISADAQTALMMGYERTAIVLKESLVIYNLFDPTRTPVTIPAQIIPQLLPSLCSATSDCLILTSYNTIQQWAVNPKTAQARVTFQSHAEGFGFCEVAAYDETIAAISEGGHKLHLYDTYSPDPNERTEDSEVAITSPIPITKLYIDEEFIITGLADGTMKLYDRELRSFLAQLNVIPVAARGLVPASGDGHTTAAPAYLQHKISFLARYDELVIASMLDPAHNEKSSSAPQLEISIWPIRGQNVVQPLKTKLLPGAVNFVHFEDRNALLMALTQHDLSEPDSPKFAPTNHGNNFANRGPLVLLSWHPPFKSLMASGIKWRETNGQQQAKLAAEVMEKVLLEPSFFRAMFNVEADQEEIDQIIESMFISLSGKDSLQATFIETAIAQEIILRRTNGVQSASSAPLLSQSTPLSESEKDSATTKSTSSMSHSASSIPQDLADRSNASSTAPATPPQYFPHNAMTTAVITKCLSELSSGYMSYVLSKPLALLLKGPVSHMMFSLPSTQATVEEQPMISNLIRVTSGIIDGLIENQAKFTTGLQRMLASIHQAICADNYPDSELKSFRRGVARVFLDYVILRPWLEPIEAGLANKLTDEARHNLRVVAQLMQVIAGYSKHKLIDPGLCSLVTEYSTKWRSWLLSKVSESQGERDGTPKSKDKRKNMARGASFVAQKSGNNKTAAMVVTKFIITHVQELLTVMTRFEGRTPDPTATKIRAISDSLMMPIMTMMAKKGTKNVHLAASLRVFGRSGSMPSGSTNSSGSSHTHSSSDSVSSESVGGPKDETATSEGKAAAPREATSSPVARKKPKRKSSTASAPQSIDSGSSEGRMASATSSEAGLADIRSDSGVPIALRKSPRPKKPKSRTINKKISSGSLTASSVEEEKDEDLSDSSDDALPPRAQSVDAIRVVGEVDVTVHAVPPAPGDLSASSGDIKTPNPRRKRKSRPPGLPVIHDVPSH
jgi:hypothetical protein